MPCVADQFLTVTDKELSNDEDQCFDRYSAPLWSELSPIP